MIKVDALLAFHYKTNPDHWDDDTWAKQYSRLAYGMSVQNKLNSQQNES